MAAFYFLIWQLLPLFYYIFYKVLPLFYVNHKSNILHFLSLKSFTRHFFIH